MVKKMAPMDVVRMHGLLEQEHRRVSEVASTFAQGLPVWSSSWARITSPMYWQHV